MILHWDQIVLHYGQQGNQSIKKHREKFRRAHETTYGILYSPICFDDCDVKASMTNKADGTPIHAEVRLLNTDCWKTQIPLALSRFHAGHDDSFNVIMGLNRTPCNKCTGLLVDALHELHRKFPLRTTQNRFILACLGAYRPYETERVDNRTSMANLTALKNAGWELCVLQVDDELTAYGNMLENSLQSLGFRGIMRLDQPKAVELV